MTAKSTLYINSTNQLRVLGLRDFQGNYQNAATVTLESLTSKRDGSSVTGLSYPVALVYEAASNGQYSIALPASIGVLPGEVYIAVVKAVSGSFEAQWTESIRVERNTA